MIYRRQFLTFIALLINIYSCTTSESVYFEKEYYERISGIKFPKNIHAIESFDNGEFVTTTTLVVDSIELLKFISKYKFEPRKKIYPTQFMGNITLKGIKPDFDKLDNLYFLDGSKGKNSWFYIIDTKRNILWAEVQYPDWGGT